MVNSSNILRYIQYCTALILLTKGFAHFTCHQPYAAVFSTGTDSIQYLIGGGLMFFGILVLFPLRQLKLFRLSYALIIPSMLLLLHSYCSYVQANYVAEQMIEHALQIGLPLVIFASLHISFKNTEKTIQFIKVLAALAFIGHGMFALGVHYVPGYFMQTTTDILHLSNDSTSTFLFVIGILDILSAVLLFLPIPLLYRSALIYMIVWGTLTALVRMYHGIIIHTPVQDLLLQNLPNALYRLPHGLVPLVLYSLCFMPVTRRTQRTKESPGYSEQYGVFKYEEGIN